MDSTEAKTILSIYRPGVDDGDPQFAEALKQAECDPELGAWFAEERASYANVRRRLRAIEPPADLRAKILRERPVPFPKAKSVVRVWQIAAAVAVFAGIAGFFVRDFWKSGGELSQTRVAAGGVKEGATVTVTGEVLDMACYIASNLSGPDHAECARTCIRNGLPVGIKGPDGRAYLLVGANEPLNAQLADHAAMVVTVKGVIRQRDGFLMLDQATIEKL